MYITVRITTFKPSGKYYNEWNITVCTEQNTWHNIIETIRKYKSFTSPAPVYADMDWLIGMDNSRTDMYPIIIKGN